MIRKLSLQFHALLEEITEVIIGIVEKSNVVLTLALGRPCEFVRWNGDIQCLLSRKDVIEAFAFTISQPRLDAISVNDFLKLNPEALILTPGRLSVTGLSESWLAAMTDDETAMKEWRKIAQKFRNITTGGIEAVNPKTGAKAFIKSNRYTEGAHQLYRNGVLLLPAAGNSILQIPNGKQ